MSNLPISTQTPPSSGGSINPAPASNATNNQEATPFASLLARQIGEADPANAGANVVPFAGIAEGATSLKKSKQDTASMAQDPGSVIANTPIDPGNALNTIMLQLPPEVRTQAKVEAPAVSAQQAATGDSIALGTAVDVNPANSANASPLNARGTVTDNLKAATLTSSLARNETQLAPVENSQPGKLFAPPSAADKTMAALSLVQDAPKYTALSASQVDHNNASANIAALLTGTTTNAATVNAATLNRRSDSALTVNTPLGGNGWAEDFSQQISWLSTQKNQVAELHLNPPNLGPLDVVLTITDKQATIQFSSPHGAVRDAVENALPKLREVFADNGIMLGNTTVSDQTPRERNAAGFLNQDAPPGAPRETADDATLSVSMAPIDTPVSSGRRHIGMIDTFA